MYSRCLSFTSLTNSTKLILADVVNNAQQSTNLIGNIAASATQQSQSLRKYKIQFKPDKMAGIQICTMYYTVFVWQLIIYFAQQSTNLIGNIAASATQQSQSLRLATQEMEQISEIVQTTAATAEPEISCMAADSSAILLLHNSNCLEPSEEYFLAGKGFAVVAGEVQSLANKSAEAAKNISGLISESISLIEQGASLTNSTKLILADVVNNAQQSYCTGNEWFTYNAEW